MKIEIEINADKTDDLIKRLEQLLEKTKFLKAHRAKWGMKDRFTDHVITIRDSDFQSDVLMYIRP